MSPRERQESDARWREAVSTLRPECVRAWGIYHLGRLIDTDWTKAEARKSLAYWRWDFRQKCPGSPRPVRGEWRIVRISLVPTPDFPPSEPPQ